MSETQHNPQQTTGLAPFSERLLAHLRFVRQHSQYYRELWQDAWPDASQPIALADLPVVDSKAFWEANLFENNRVLTAGLAETVVFKSGGTTGNPKYSYFSYDDWRAFCQAFGDGLKRAGMRSDERVANLFYGGQLYASFMFIARSMEEAGVGVQFPVSGMASEEEMLKTIEFFKIETLAVVPTTMMKLLPSLAKMPPEKRTIKRVIYGGEPMQADQVAAVQSVLPGCRVESIGVAGVDYGELGFVDETCELGVHRMFDGHTQVELLDDDLLPIESPGQAGYLYMTNLNRRLMPVVRYPVGDRAEWLDEPGTPARRFRLLGRSQEGARIGPVSVYIEDIQKILDGVSLPQQVISFQLVVEHADQKDRGRLRLAVAEPEGMTQEQGLQVRDEFYRQRTLYPDLVAQSLLHPFEVEWIGLQAMHTNPRTGKLLRVVDRRAESNV